MSLSSLKHRIYYLIILTIIERSEFLYPSYHKEMDWVFPPLLLLSLAHYPLPSGAPILLISVTKKNRRKRKRRVIVLYRTVLRFINLTVVWSSPSTPFLKMFILTTTCEMRLSSVPRPLIIMWVIWIWSLLVSSSLFLSCS